MERRCVVSNARSDAPNNTDDEVSLHNRRRAMRRAFSNLLQSTLMTLQTPGQIDVCGGGIFQNLNIDVLTHFMEVLAKPDARDENETHGVRFMKSVEFSSKSILALASTCKFLNTILKVCVPWLRLELCARSCTQLTPSRLQSCNYPFVDQYTREMRTRVDIKMFELALKGMVCHCAGAQNCKFNCAHARTQHNLIHGKPDNERSILWSFALKNAVPRVKSICQTSRAIAVASDANVCVVLESVFEYSLYSTFGDSIPHDRVRYKLNYFMDETPTIWKPGSEARLCASMTLPRAQCAGPRSLCSTEITQSSLKVSSCGRFACVFEAPVHWSGFSRRPSASTLDVVEATIATRRWVVRVQVWKIGGAVQTIEAGAIEAEHCNGEVLVPHNAWFRSQSEGCDPELIIYWTKVVEGQDSVVDEYRSHIVAYNLDETETFRSNKVVWNGNVHPVSSHPTSSGNMLAVLTEELDYGLWNNIEILDLTNGSLCLVHGRSRLVELNYTNSTIQMNASGDTFVVLTTSSATNRWHHLRVYTRMSTSTYHRVRKETVSRLDPTPNSTFENGPPLANGQNKWVVFSPCGRFLILLGAGMTCLSSTYTPSQSHVEALLILDLSDRVNGLLGSISWILSIRNQIPLDVKWNSSGLWLRTRHGVLLIGTRVK